MGAGACVNVWDGGIFGCRCREGNRGCLVDRDRGEDDAHTCLCRSHAR